MGTHRVNPQSSIHEGDRPASWPSGKARVCKTLIMGSNPIDASVNEPAKARFLFQKTSHPDLQRFVLNRSGSVWPKSPTINNIITITRYEISFFNL